MTATQQRLVDMIPQMQSKVPYMSDDKAQQIINLFVTVEEPEKKAIKLGIADGKYIVPDDPNAYDDEVAEMFGV